MHRVHAQVLGRNCRVYALDLRFHGDSGRPTWVPPPPPPTLAQDGGVPAWSASTSCCAATQCLTLLLYLFERWCGRSRGLGGEAARGWGHAGVPRGSPSRRPPGFSGGPQSGGENVENDGFVEADSAHVHHVRLVFVLAASAGAGGKRRGGGGVGRPVQVRMQPCPRSSSSPLTHAEQCALTGGAALRSWRRWWGAAWAPPSSGRTSSSSGTPASPRRCLWTRPPCRCARRLPTAACAHGLPLLPLAHLRCRLCCFCVLVFHAVQETPCCRVVEEQLAHVVTVGGWSELCRCGAQQNRAEDWTLGSHGCYDVASLTRTQMQLRYDFTSVAQARPPPAVCFPAHNQDQAQITSRQWRCGWDAGCDCVFFSVPTSQATCLQGNCEGCLSKDLGAEVCMVLCRETLKADPQVLPVFHRLHCDWDSRYC